MPKRPVQHELETASRIAFEGLLPKGWVFREMRPDYGIDGEVEIFKNGAATGLTFKVQLKATGTDELMIRLDQTKDAYYSALRLPVLLVLFHQPTESVFIRWFHSLDPYSEGYGDTGGAVFRFGEEHLWDDDTPNRLLLETEMFYKIRDSHRALPLELAIDAASDGVNDVPAREIETRLRSLLAPYREVVRVTAPGTTGEHGTITLSSDGIRVDLQGAASYTMHYHDVPNLDAERLAHDSAVVFALLLDHIGQVLPAARLLEEVAERSAAIRNPDTAPRVGSILIRAGRPDAALKLSTLLQENEEPLVSAALLELPLLLTGGSLTRGERTKVADQLLEQAGHFASEGSAGPAAAASRNAAMWLVGLDRPEDALAALDRAVELDPAYANRAYFHRERGGALFLLGRFRDASEAYARALEMGEDVRVLALYADALFFAGQFAEAREAFAKFNAEFKERIAEWQLKEWVLESIIEAAGDTQEIDVAEGCRIASESDSAGTTEAREKKLLEALARDGLCGQAWEKMGVLRAEEDRFHEALPCFVIAGLNTRVLRPWMLALSVSLDLMDDPIFRDIVKTAYFFLRDDFAEGVGTVSDRLEPMMREKLLTFLRDVTAEVHEQAQTVEFRILSESGYTSLPLSTGPNSS